MFVFLVEKANTISKIYISTWETLMAVLKLKLMPLKNVLAASRVVGILLNIGWINFRLGKFCLSMF